MAYAVLRSAQFCYCFSLTGVFMLNLISRDDDIKREVINDIKTVFPLVFTRGGEDEVNETLYAISRACSPATSGPDAEQASSSRLTPSSASSRVADPPLSQPEDASNSATALLRRLSKCGRQLQKLAQSSGKEHWDPETDLCEILRQLEIR